MSRALESPWRIELLGGLTLRQGERCITRFSTQKTAALLAYLACHPGQAHAREILVDQLWGDAAPEAGRACLSTALSSLRRQLEPPGIARDAVICADRFAVRVHPEAVVTDVAQFERACNRAERSDDPAGRVALRLEALALYRGTFLPGHYLDWILAEQTRLGELFGRTVSKLVCDLEALGEVDRARAVLQDATRIDPGASFAALERRRETPERRPPRLPLQFLRFFGRDGELTQMTDLLSPRAGALVTLTGAGGTGKTRLSVETGARLADAYGGAVWFVTLADLWEAHLVPGAIRDALGLPRRVECDPLEQAAAHLQSQPSLLLLDNLEHLLPAAAATVLALRHRCPDLCVLVTSRRRLALPGERELPLAPLPVPGPDAQLPEAVLRSASAQLFVDRAQAVRPDFQITPRNAPAVAALCVQLEGVPLALELAAARIQTLTPAQMTERLSRRFDLLVSRRADREARHLSLWTAIDWSHDLLPAPLQRFFARMSVFRGSFALDAAEAVSGEPRALEYLTQLRERSLLLAEESDGEMRYRLMESLREFGSEQLTAQEADALAADHARHYAALTKESTRFHDTPQMAGWLDRLETDHENLRASLRWLQTQDDPIEGLSFAGAMGRFWTLRGHVAEGRRVLEPLLERTPRDGPLRGDETRIRAEALALAGSLAWWQSDLNAASARLAESVPLYRATDDLRGLLFALIWSGNVAYARGDFAAAHGLYSECLERARRSPGETGALAYALLWLGNVCLAQEDTKTAAGHYEDSLRVAHAMGDRQCMAFCRLNLGRMDWHAGRYAAAEEHLSAALRLNQKLGDRAGMIESLETLSVLDLARGEATRAASLLAAASAGRKSSGIRRRRSAMGAFEDAFEAAQRALSTATDPGADLDAAVTLALSQTGPASSP